MSDNVNDVTRVELLDVLSHLSPANYLTLYSFLLTRGHCLQIEKLESVPDELLREAVVRVARSHAIREGTPT